MLYCEVSHSVIVSLMEFWVVHPEILGCWGLERGGGGSPKAYFWDIIAHISLWSEFGPWLNGRYPPAEIFIPVVPQILSIASLFCFLPVVAGPLSTFL